MGSYERDIGIVVVVLVLAVAGVLIFFQDWQECADRGGVLTRGTIGYECVEKK